LTVIYGGLKSLSIVLPPFTLTSGCCYRAVMPKGSPQTLRHFIYRSQVLSLYRQFVRATRSLGGGPSRAELTQEVRRNFEAQKQVADLQAIKFHLSEGRKRLEQLQDMLGLQR
ncbi:hypothetical protein Agub_g15386, partial [Astrephomene gubernaculifera]